MNSSRITYMPHLDATPETEISALASVYKFVLDCHAKKNAVGAGHTNGDDAKKGSPKHEVRATQNYTG